VVDRVTGKTSRRDLETRRDAQDADRIAVAVVELVDASLSELDLDHTTLQSETKPSAGLRKRGQAAGDDAPGQRDDAARPVSPAPWDDPEAKQAARKDAPDGYRFGFGVEGGVVWPVRESGVFGIGRVQAGYLPDRHSWIGPEVTFPLHTFVRERDGRRVESLLFAFGVLGSYDVMQERPPVHLDIIGAFDAVALVVRQKLGDRDTNETLWTGTAALGLRVRVEIGRLDLGITTRLDVPFVPRRIRVDDVLVQDFSAVWLSGTAGARVRW
jgi:hypothetical protein